MLKSKEKPRFKYLQKIKFWYFDDGNIFLSSQNISKLYEKYLTYKSSPESTEIHVLIVMYPDMKENLMLLEELSKGMI